MKTLKIRIVTAEKITTQMKDEFLLGAKTMQIPGILDVEIKFATIKNVLKGIKLESDDDIDQEWLASKVSDGRYHWVHLHVTDREWRKAGLRRSLYGQCELVNRQLITYGRWSVKSVYKFAQNYPAPFNLLPELVLGLWHEGCHGLTKLFALIMGIPYDSVRQKVHHAFYGWNRMYTKQEEEDGLAHRWKVEPTPMQLWLSFPWDLLPDTHQTTLDKLQALIASLTAPKLPTALLPVVETKMEQLIVRAKAAGLVIRVTSKFRSFEEQAIEYAKGRTTPGPVVTNAKPGESMHNYGLAFDVCFVGTEPYPPLSSTLWTKLFAIADGLGLESYGQRYKWDYPHFQYLGKYTENDVKNGKVNYKEFNL